MSFVPKTMTRNLFRRSDNQPPISIVCILAFLLWIPNAEAQILLDVTQTGAELAVNPEIIFHQPPTVDGDSAIFTSVGESFLFEWPLLTAATRSTTVVEITVDFTPLTADSDSTWGLHDGSNLVGYMRVDNSSGALFSREGTVSGIALPAPPQLTSAPTSLDPVDPFTMSFFMPGGGGPTAFEFMEASARHTDEFSDHPINGSGDVTLFFGGGNDNGESYRINSFRVQVRGMQESTAALAYFPLANCGVVNTGRSDDGKLGANETRRFIVRGESTDFSAQGGSASGCGVPQNAEAIVANFWVFNFDGNGSLRVGATGKNLGATEGTLIRYNGAAVFNQANATVLDLCDNDTCTSDFQVNAQGAGSGTNLVVSVMGYFAPIEGVGLTTIDTTITDPLTVTGDGGIEIDGGDLVQAPNRIVSIGSTNTPGVMPTGVVSGRYAYSVDPGGALNIVDIQNPAAPVLVSTTVIGSGLNSISVADPYAYVTSSESSDLTIIDISDPRNPVAVGSLVIVQPLSVAVSGRHAYVAGTDRLSVVLITDPANPTFVHEAVLPIAFEGQAEIATANGYLYVVSGAFLTVFTLDEVGTPSQVSSTALADPGSDLFVADDYAHYLAADGQTTYIYDVSDPANPTLVQFFTSTTGMAVRDVFVSGRYLYYAGEGFVQVIDISAPLAPMIVEEGIAKISGTAHSLSVVGHHIYAQTEGSLQILELAHGELAALTADSLETGQLRARNDGVIQGDLRVAGGINVGAGGISSSGSVGVGGALSFAEVASDVTLGTGAVQLFAQDDGSGAELKVQDAAGNRTTLSPHNFSLIGEPSEPLAWSYYSESAQGRINVDMLRVVRLLEKLTGESLVVLDPAAGSEVEELEGDSQSLLQQLRQLEKRLEELEAKSGSN